MIRTPLFSLLLFLVATVLLTGCGLFDRDETVEVRTLEVIATAYNSLPAQTHEDHPTITAWGDKLKPGMKCIPVSRDLIAKGLDHDTEVIISGRSGTYTVLDKMNERYTHAIDIYMGVDKEAALEWGRKEVTITWEVSR